MGERAISWQRVGECFACTNHNGGVNGYPALKINKVKQTIARWILLKRHGDLTNRIARHTCDNRKCIRPDHIVIGTHKDNMDDMRNRGREKYLKGDEAPYSKLTSSDVKEIRSRRGTYSQYELASEFGVDQSTISYIQTKKRWKHI